VAEVKIQDGESIESALRRFKRRFSRKTLSGYQEAFILLEAGDKRRAKQALARKRNRKKLRRELE